MAGYDENLEFLLQGFGDGILAYTKGLQDRVDELEADTLRLEDALAREERLRQRDVEKLGAIGSLAYEVDARRLSDADAMAKIRGMFHE